MSKDNFIIVLLVVIVLLTYSVMSLTFGTIGDIQHIQNVDEMQATPKEIYIYTNKGKYMFDGQQTIHLETY